MGRDQELRRAFSDWLREVLAFLKPRPVPGAYDVVITFDEQNNGVSNRSGWTVTQGDLRMDVRRLVSQYSAEFQSLEATDTLSARLRAIPDAHQLLKRARASMVVDDQSVNMVAPEICDAFLRDYLRRTKQFVYVSEAFTEVFQSLETFMLSPERLEVVVLVEYFNLLMDVSRIDLEKGVFLRQTTDDEHIAAAKRISRDRDFGRTIPEAYLEIHVPVDPLSSVMVERQAHDVSSPFKDALLLALRLISPQYVEHAGLLYGSANPFVLILGPEHRARDPITGGREPYRITSKVGNELREIWPLAKQAINDPTLTFAINRLRDTYWRTNPADQLVDYWIVLEGLFAREDTRELRYRSSLRIARLLGKSQEERLQLYKDMKTSYDFRSMVVHGGDPHTTTKKLRKQWGALPSVTALTGDIVRRALRCWVDPASRPESPGEIDRDLLA